MSRIGNKTIELADKVAVTVSGKDVTVKGPKGELSHTLPAAVDAAVEGNTLVVTRIDDTRESKSQHGLNRSLLNNMVQGVSTGFKKDLEIIGVGYRAQMKGNTLVLMVGYSNPTEFQVPDGVTVAVNDNTKISVEGHDKQQVGQVAAVIRGVRPPEPYKGKGIRYVGEYIMMKQGKSV